jgi:hypothetical protein
MMFPEQAKLLISMSATSTKRRLQMKKTTISKAVRIGAAVAVFASGWFCGTLSQRSAEAQMGDLGKSVLEKAGEQGGSLGAAAKLGTSISDIQTHLNELQKNVDTLKSIKSMLGG